MNFWKNHFEERARKLGDLPQACDHKDRIAFFSTKDALKKLLRDVRSKKILDVGCGNGLLMDFLINHNEIWGIDFSLSMLKIARERNIITVGGEASNIPLKSNTFDYVLGIGLLQYTENEIEVIREMIRVLKKRGTIILSLLHRNSILRRMINRTGLEKLNLKEFNIPEIKYLLKSHQIGEINFRFLSYPFPFSLTHIPLPLVTTFLIKGKKIA